MSTIRAPHCDADFGHRDPRHTQFIGLTQGDSRVSLAEQQDYQPEVAPMPVWLALAFFLVALPLLGALVVWLVRLSLS